MGDEENVGENSIITKEPNRINAGDTVLLLDNINISATGIEIPEDWHTLLFTVNTVYDDTVLIVNLERHIYARIYMDDLDIVEVSN